MERPAKGFFLAEADAQLVLCRADEPQSRGVGVTFDTADIRRRVATGKRLLLAQALGLQHHKHVRVLDATCGLGRDSAVLAGLGCRVTALERHPALYALVSDALRRVQGNPPRWRGEWLALHHAHAHHWLSQRDNAMTLFDAIYIDPMFDSPRRKARPQQALQWMHELLGPDEDAAELLALARQQARRVVVKSHARAAPLASPDHQVAGKAMRFDVYFNASNDSR